MQTAAADVSLTDATAVRGRVHEVGQHIGPAPMQGAPELGEFVESVRDTAADRVITRVSLALPRRQSWSA